MVILSPDGPVVYVKAFDLVNFALSRGAVSFWAPDAKRYWLTNVVLARPEKVRLEGTNVYVGGRLRRGLRTAFTVDVGAPIPIIIHQEGTATL